MINILIFIGAVLSFAVHVNTGGPGSLCPGGSEEWEKWWINDTHPTGNEDHEPIPYDAQYICPPDEGRLLIRCTSDDNGNDPETSFTGRFYDNFNKNEVECSAKNGSVCRVQAKGGLCLDYAIQIGCDCTNPKGTTKPALSGGQGTTKLALSGNPRTAPQASCGPVTTAKTPTNCSCPARNSPLQNSAPQCLSKKELFVLVLGVVTVSLKV